MKKHNPETPIMIREALNVEPKVYARYGAHARAWESNTTSADTRTTELGREKMVPLKGGAALPAVYN